MSLNFKKVNIINFPIAMVSLLAFSIVTIIPNYFFYFFMLSTILMMIAFLTNWHQIDKKLFNYFGLFLLPSLIGCFSYPISMILEGEVFDYSQLNILGRLSNLFLLFVLILFLHTYIKDKNISLPFRWYWIGVGLLMITAIWQFTDVFLHLTNFPFETRSNLHSTYGVEYSFAKRLTGIASEPSYFVMLAIDFIILSFLFTRGLKKKILIAIGLLLVFLSLSPSGYLTLFFTLIGAYIFTKLKHLTFKFKWHSVFIFIMISPIVIMFLFYFLNSAYFDYFYNRIADPRMLDSSRAYMSYMPFCWAWESNPVSFLFGHGIKSYSIIGTAFYLPDGSPVHVTSNNLFVDTFWEAGLLGIIVLLVFFIYVISRAFKIKYSKVQSFSTFFVLFNLVFSSIFRADFASFRFFILLYLVFILIHYDLRSIKGFHV